MTNAAAPEIDEEIREFLIESNENLSALDQDVVHLEENPTDVKLISSAFRTIHTIKGTCGFFGFEILQSVAHITENILSQARDGKRTLTPGLISLVLEALDAIKKLLARIEGTGAEGEDFTEQLRLRLEAAHRGEAFASTEPGKGATPAAPAAKIPAVAAPLPTPTVSAEATPAALTLPKTQDPAPTATATEASEEAKESSKDSHLADSTIRVDVGLLNRLMNLVGELVLARNQLLQDAPVENTSLQTTTQRLNLITSELQEGVMKTRMQPISVVWNKLPRVVRDLAAKCGKRIHIDIDGADTELDKTIIEAIKDPLTHIVRNCCDHGIEVPEERIRKNKKPEGLLRMCARHEGGVVTIEISDDGAGIDPQRIKLKALEKGLIRPEEAPLMSLRDARNLIFLPGFSTAAQITSISGRGVGMDVVKTNIEKIGGSVEVLDQVGGGTTMRINIPLTLAIIPGLVVMLTRVPGPLEQDVPAKKLRERFIIPQASLLEVVRVENADLSRRVENVHGTPVFHHRGRLLPLVYLRRILQKPVPVDSKETVNILVLQAEATQMGLVVDEIGDTQEIVVKPLGRQLKDLNSYIGATIMGDGRPALILSVSGLAQLAGLGVRPREVDALNSVEGELPQPKQMMLLFRAGGSERLAVPLSLVDRLEVIRSADIEHAAGRTVLNYRDTILPLLTVSRLLHPKESDTTFSREKVPVIVFTDGFNRVGLAVDEIIDVFHESVTVRKASDRPGLLGSAAIGGRITDLFDFQALMQDAGENWANSTREQPNQGSCVLLLDRFSINRETLGSLLEMFGYHVLHANTVEEAMRQAKQHAIDLILVSSDARNPNGCTLAETLQQRSDLQRTPVVVLQDSNECVEAACDRHALRIPRSDRAALLNAIANLIERSPMKEAVHP